MGITPSSEDKNMEILFLKNSTIDSVRNCPIEILARIAMYLGPGECERLASFFPEIEQAWEIAQAMNWGRVFSRR